MTASFKGEAQGTFRMVPHPPPLKPLSATPHKRLLSGGRIMLLAFSASFFCREKGFVLVCVFSHRFLIFGRLKIANSQSLRQCDFLYGDLD